MKQDRAEQCAETARAIGYQVTAATSPMARIGWELRCKAADGGRDLIAFSMTDLNVLVLGGLVARVEPPVKALPLPPEPCSENCPGWAVFQTGRGLEIQRCDGCWSDVAGAPDDDEYAAHPTCKAALAAEQREGSEPRATITNRAGEFRSADGADAVQAFALKVLASSLRLEIRCPGLKASRVSALKTAKRLTGLKTNDRAKQLAEVERLLKTQVAKCRVVSE